MELQGAERPHWDVVSVDLDKHDQHNSFKIGRKSFSGKKPDAKLNLAVPMLKGVVSKKASVAGAPDYSTHLVSGRHWAFHWEEGARQEPPVVFLTGGWARNSTKIDGAIAIKGIGRRDFAEDDEKQIEVPHGAVVHTEGTLYAVVDRDDSLHDKLADPESFAEYVGKRLRGAGK